MQIHILLQKPTDLDLHCLQNQSISLFSRTRVKTVACVANNVDSDQMQYSMASDLGVKFACVCLPQFLHCLLKPVCPNNKH